jgi:hypothetical protein
LYETWLTGLLGNDSILYVVNYSHYCSNGKGLALRLAQLGTLAIVIITKKKEGEEYLDFTFGRQFAFVVDSCHTPEASFLQATDLGLPRKDNIVFCGI